MHQIKIILTEVLLFAASTMSAAVGGTLTITTLDGIKQEVDLTNKPIITMNENELIVKLSNSELRYDIQKVADFRYTEITDVKTVVVKSSPMQQNGDQLRFVADGTSLNVRITNVAGVLINSFDVAAGTNENISLSNLATGIYLVTVNGETYKIIKP